MAKNTFKQAKESNPKEKSTKPKIDFDKIKAITQDKRYNLIIGGLMILFSVYLTIAFTSYFVVWKYDQDKLFLPAFDLLTNSDITVENWLGKIGAIISHLFIYNWFGLASFSFVLILFVVGVKIIFKHSILPIRKMFKSAFWLTIWFSIAFGFFFSDAYHLGGSFGFQLSSWFKSALGSFGTLLLVVFFLFSIAVGLYHSQLLKLKAILLKESSDDIETSIEDNPETTIEDNGAEENEDSIISRQLSEDDLAPTDFKPITEAAEALETVIEDTEVNIPIEPSIETIDSESISEDSVEATIDEQEPEIEEEQVIVEFDNTPPTPITNEELSSEGFEVELAEDKEVQLDEKDLEKKLQEFGEYDPKLDLSNYKLPTLELLIEHGDNVIEVDKDELEKNKNNIITTLLNYKIEISKISATVGPTITLYEIVPAPGVRISKIKNLEDDIALSLAALGIRIIAPMPGKGTIGIEVPNRKAQVVSMKTLLQSDKFQNSEMELPLALGKTISNESFVFDLAKMPHLLMAGATGQGKSVGLNAILGSILYKKHPSQVKFVLVDPKKVELTLFNKIERHFLAKLPGDEDAIITDTSAVVKTLNSLCAEMDNRYELLKDAQVRNIKEYNSKFVNRRLNPENGHKFLPYIVLVIDEFADLIMTAGKEVETPIARLAQLARAIGIHLIVATQRPSVNVITGIIKANFPARIAFRVTSKIDSRTILDTGGADQLIGRGDMLFSPGNELVRLQCGFLDTPEVENICDYIGEQQGYAGAFILPEVEDEAVGESGKLSTDMDRDVMFEDAARLVVQTQQGSTSMIQRKLKLGYNRAGRIVDQLESAGILGPFEGSKARKVLIPDEYALEMFLNNNE